MFTLRVCSDNNFLEIAINISNMNDSYKKRSPLFSVRDYDTSIDDVIGSC